MKFYIAILCLTLITLFNLTTNAQKVSLTKVKVNYQQLPLQPLNENIKTYNSVLDMNVTLENTDNNKLSNQYLKLHGYDKVNEEEDILIQVEYSDFILDNKLIADNVYNVNQGKNVMGYYYELTCTYPVKLTLIAKSNQIIFEKEIKHDEKLMHKDFEKWTYSQSELDIKFNTKKNDLINEIKNKCDKKSLMEIRDILISNFSYYNVNTKIKIASGKGRKIDYSDLESAVLHVEKAFELISSEATQEKIYTELNKAITIWKKALTQSATNKDARINEEISSMLYYNIGIAYWWMFNFEKADAYLNKALEKNAKKSKPSSSDEKLIKEVIETMKDYHNRLKIHHKI